MRLARVALIWAALGLFGCSEANPVGPNPPADDLKPVTVTIVGGGTVTSVPSGLTCEGGTCTARFPPGWKIALWAGAHQGWSFAGWQGDCTGTETKCDLTTDAARTLTATFTR